MKKSSKQQSGSNNGNSDTSKKNILLIMVDQLRFPRFCYGDDGGLLPELKEIIGFQGEVDGENSFKEMFPGFWAMRQHATVLRNHTIAASACTPSRCTVMTGQYGTRTGVTQTDGLFKNADAPNFPWLAADGIPTVGEWFRRAGYRSHYFGKWHVSNPPGHTLQEYGFDDWEQSWPEPHGASINNLGVYRDYQFADLACTFLRNQALGVGYNRALAQQQATAPLGEAPPTTPQPWFAVVSFTNPHDIAAYPALVRGIDPNAPPIGPLPVPQAGSMSNLPTAGTYSFPLNPYGFPQNNANLPPNVAESLSNKPSCQFDYSYKMGLALAAKTGQGAQQINAALNPVMLALNANIPFQLAHNPEQSALQFIQYYAWLMQTVDEHIARVLETLDEVGQRENTIVVFLADHGEYAGAHNFMMEKWHTAYQEALHVPVVVQSSSINPDATTIRQIDGLSSHIDILPTLMGLANISPDEQAQIRAELQKNRPVPPLPGVDLTPVLKDPTTPILEADGSPREGVLFITDDEITVPLEGGGKYQVNDNRAFEIYLQTVSAVRDGSGPGPRPPHVPELAPGPVRQPNHVRCVRTADWKLSRYWDPSGTMADEWEMYDLAQDPTEMINLLVTNAAFPTPIASLPAPYTQEAVAEKAMQLRALLETLEARNLTAEDLEKL